MGITEKCFYCGLEYHPMPRFTYAGHDKSPHGQLIYVCEWHPVYDGGDLIKLDFEHNCIQKALDDGYEMRRDLTPTR